jgi:hypothetical protein
LLMPNSKHLTHGISNLVSLITKTKLGLSTATTYGGAWQRGSSETVETKVKHGEASGAYHDH